MEPRLGAVVLVTDAHDRLLLGRRGKDPNRGMWVIPGGGVRGGESWRDAGRRELLEETGLEVLVSADESPFVLEILNHDEHRLILCTTGSVTGGELRASSDLLEARFFARGELPDSVSRPVQAVLQAFGWLDGSGMPTVEGMLERLLREKRHMTAQVTDLQARGTRFMEEEQEFRITLRRIAEAREGRDYVAGLAAMAADVLARCPR